MKDLSILDFFKAGAHFGHRTRFWHPKMQPYIYGARNDIHIINLDETVEKFKVALDFIHKIATNNGKLMFVGTKRPAAKTIKAEASRCGMPYVDYRWLGGMLTNYKTIRQSMKKLLDLEAKVASGYFDKLTKKESLELQREQSKLERNLGGFKNIAGLPDALFVVDVRYEKIAIKEANRVKIPVIGIVDTNNNPEGIDYVIPGNDDSIKAIQLFASTIADVILAATPKSSELGKDL